MKSSTLNPNVVSTPLPKVPFEGVSGEAIVRSTGAGMVVAEQGLFARVVRFFRGESRSESAATREAVVDDLKRRLDEQGGRDGEDGGGIDRRIVHQALLAARGESGTAARLGGKPITVRQIRDAYHHARRFAPALALRAARLEAARHGPQSPQVVALARQAGVDPAHLAVSQQDPVAGRVRSALLQRVGVTQGQGILVPAGDAAVQAQLSHPDQRPAKDGDRLVREVKHSGAGAPEFFGNGFFQDVHRMQVLLADGGEVRRIGGLSAPDATEAHKLATRKQAIDELVEFVGDESFAARVSRFISQNATVPLAEALQDPNGPIHLPDGTRGQLTPGPHTSFTLTKGGDGEIQVRLELDYRSVTHVLSLDGVRQVDPAQSYAKLSLGFSITRDAVHLTAPMTYDFVLAEQAPQGQ